MGACKSKKSAVAPQPPKEPPKEQPAPEPPPAQAHNDPPPPAQATEPEVAERAPENPPASVVVADLPPELAKVQRILAELRDCTGFAHWKPGAQAGWDQLGSYRSMEELGEQRQDKWEGGVYDGTSAYSGSGLYGVSVKDGQIHKIDLHDANLRGVLPASIAELSSLESLCLFDNKLEGSLPPLLGSPRCLPNLKELDVANNPALRGAINAEFLVQCDHCDVRWCGVETPYLAGVSFASDDIAEIFRHAPDEVVDRRRWLPHVQMVSHYDHPRFGQCRWVPWQDLWLDGLETIRTGFFFVFISDSFKEKYTTVRYVAGNGAWRKLHGGASNEPERSAEECCMLDSFDPTYGLPDGVSAHSIPHWKQLHLEIESKQKQVPVVFMAFRPFRQIPRPDWYAPFSGLEAPIGLKTDEGREPSHVSRGRLSPPRPGC